MKVAPGRAGWVPQVALFYDSGIGNGPLGPGWRLAGMVIRRQTDKGLPRYGDTDSYLNERGEELVRVEGTPTDAIQVFRTKNEGSFTRYEFRRTEDRWICHDRSGNRYLLGSDGRGGASARVQHPAGGTWSWHAVEAADTNGNLIRTSYSNDRGQLYPARIEYGALERGDAGAVQAVDFGWETRPDPFVDYRPTFRLVTGLRLASVTMSSGGNLVRRYRLEFAAAGQRPISTLMRVTVVGRDGASELPPVDFDYTLTSLPSSSALIAISGAGHVRLAASGNTDSGAAELFDFDADALPDFYVSRNASSPPSEYDLFYQSIGAGSFQQRKLTEAESLGLPLQSATTFMRDLDGNGTSDVLAQTGAGTQNFIQRRNERGRWVVAPETVTLPSGASPQEVFLSSEVRAADLDFDKRVDTLRAVVTVTASGTGIAFVPYYCRGNGTIEAGQRTSIVQGLPASQTFATSNGRLLLADMNGDRLQDLVLLRHATNGGPLWWPAMGFGCFDDSTSGYTFASPPNFAGSDTRLNAAEVQDINGDGLADVLEIEGRLFRCWMNLDGTRFSQPLTVDLGGFYDSAYATWRLADIDADGLTDLVFYVSSQPFPNYLPVGLHYKRLFGPTPPNLLRHASNGIGRTTTVEYRSHIRDLMRDRDEGAEWESPPPFPVTVVGALLESDGLHSYRSEFTYSGGYWDGGEKEFRGFASAVRCDIGDVTAPTLVSEFLFDVGRTSEALKGMLLGSELRTESGEVFSRETATWATRTLFPSTAGRDDRPVVFPFRSGLIREVIEQGNGAPVRLETESRFDDYGNQILLAEFGIVEGEDRSAGDDERVTHSTFTAANPTARSNWILDRPVRTEVRDETGLVLTEQGFTISGDAGLVTLKIRFYDDEAFLGTNEGVATRGNLTLERDWVDPTNASAFVESRRQRFDAYGNPVVLMDALARTAQGEPDLTSGHIRTVRFDPNFGIFPIEETIHLGNGQAPLSISAGWDSGFGVVTSSTDFNGNVTRYTYDDFSRPFDVFRPDDPEGWPTLRYRFNLSVSTPNGRVVNWIETMTRDREPSGAAGSPECYRFARAFMDGFGRKLMTKEEASEDGVVKVAVSGATLFDARKGVAATLQPHFSRLSGTLADQLAFEDLRDTEWHGVFQEGAALAPRSLAEAPAIRTTYDATLRVLTATNPDQSSLRRAYQPLASIMFDELDNDPTSPFANTPTTERQDGLGRTIAREESVRLDNAGEPTETVQSWVTRYRYRPDDQLVEILDPLNNRKTIAYDGLQRMTFMNDPNRGHLTFRYDALNLVERIDAKSQSILYTYDGANRPLTEDYVDEGLSFSANRRFDPTRPPGVDNLADVTFFYDAPSTDVDFGDGTRGGARNTRGMMARVVDLAGEQVASYDSRGRVEWEVRAIPDPELGVLSAFRTGFGYDASDRLTEVVYPDGDRARFAYNDRGLMERIIGGADANRPESPDVVNGINYAPSGQVTRMVTGDGAVNSRTYDARLRMTTLRVAGPDLDLINYAYSFDAVSNITRIDDLRSITVAAVGSPTRNTQIFKYDDAYRLTGVQYSWNAAGTPDRDDGGISYRYNSIGNMVRQTSDIDDRDDAGRSITNLGARGHGGPAGSSGRNGRNPGDAPGPHALTSTDNGTDRRTIPYDDNGNMLELDDLRMTWDFKDRLAATENDHIRTRNLYDFTDRRVAKIATSTGEDALTTNTFYVNRWFEVREHEQPAKYVWNGETRVARATGTLDSTATRVQRWRLREGWNMIAVAVDAADMASQIGIGTASVRAAFRWRPGTMDYEAVTASSALPPGTVLRLDMAEPMVLAVSGSLTRPDSTPVEAPGDYVGPALLEALPLSGALPPAITAAWVPRAAGNWMIARPAADGAGPFILAPGAVLHARAAQNTAIDTPSPETKIQYYHQDHLGSSNVVTDAGGVLLERTAFYPYGHPRAVESLIAGTGVLESKYGFTQKEQDPESGLTDYGARYAIQHLAIFASVDTASVYSYPGGLDLAYLYAAARPTCLTDPDGNFVVLVVAAVAAGGAAIGVASTVIEDVARTDLEIRDLMYKEYWQSNADRLVASASIGALGGGVSGTALKQAGKVTGKAVVREVGKMAGEQTLESVATIIGGDYSGEKVNEMNTAQKLQKAKNMERGGRGNTAAKRYATNMSAVAGYVTNKLKQAVVGDVRLDSVFKRRDQEKKRKDEYKIINSTRG